MNYENNKSNNQNHDRKAKLERLLKENLLRRKQIVSKNKEENKDFSVQELSGKTAGSSGESQETADD